MPTKRSKGHKLETCSSRTALAQIISYYDATISADSVDRWSLEAPHLPAAVLDSVEQTNYSIRFDAADLFDSPSTAAGLTCCSVRTGASSKAGSTSLVAPTVYLPMRPKM